MRSSTVLLTTLLLASAAQAQTVTFQQGSNGYSGQIDTNLRGEEPDADNGAVGEISVDASDGGFPSQGLLRFDGLFGAGPGQIAPGSFITSATLTLTITSAGSGIRFHEMLRAWGNASTYTGFVNGVQANDVEAASSALISLGGNDSNGNIEAGALVIDFTQALRRVQSGAAPFGWALLPWLPDGTNGVDFVSAEGVPEADRPLLAVQVSAVPEPATWLLGAAGLALVLRRARTR